jgi:ParB-like nuclease domain.
VTATEIWPTKRLSVVSLQLDKKNPRLGRETSAQAPGEIVKYLFENDKAMEVAESIARRGFFPNEPLLAIEEGGKYIVVEGNRRLAALKALREPGILDGSLGRQVERWSRLITDPASIATVPVTIAPNRRATDLQIAGRHIGTPVLAWQAENRASFILDKLSEGYNEDQLRDELGFTVAEIQKARQTRAIADMARSLDLPDEVKAKLDNPRSKIFTTIERVFESSVGRGFLKVEPSPEYGIRGTTSKDEFVKGFKKVVSDVSLGKQSSRTLNTNDDIRTYFESWDPKELPAKKRGGTFVPSDIIKGKSVSAAGVAPEPKKTGGRSNQESKTVVPRDFKIKLTQDERLIDIRKELTKMVRSEFPNAGAVMLRVFLELSIKNYLKRVEKWDPLVKKLQAKGALKPSHGPTWKHLVEEMIAEAKAKLPADELDMVEKALKRDDAAPFTIADMNAFVHSSDLPGEREIQQFWLRLAPLFRMMLERDPKP